MSKRTSLFTHRAWELLRALLCTRRGELCRNRAAITRSAFHKLFKKIGAYAARDSRTALLYGDHEISFQRTPVVHVRMHRAPAALRLKLPHIPCVTPQVDHDWEDEDDEVWCDPVRRNCLLKEEEMSDESDEGIDERAEEFITKFYEEMKQQRQISYV
ncbi:hypothetical protein SASPL_122649 [Salvia splendens]|uniref:Uncharacterized protein n=1 Tax=Salvia splendens TaxID=180675 RepID=A0A8X8ZSG5_SALSN|nr:uncharacterized protein LOC121745655 [Salvia splendens]KAG6415243.1 hypothetical protein SASPL_122649 [Salvia splendens]